MHYSDKSKKESPEYWF